MQQPYFRVKKLYPDAILPTRANILDAGIDLYAYEDVLLSSRHSAKPIEYKMTDSSYYIDDQEDPSRALIQTGIAVEFPAGYVFLIHDRSGLSAKYAVHRLAGVIDSGYAGQLKVALINLGSKAYQIKKGDRIAQGILMPIASPTIEEVQELTASDRGEAGFGSTGK
ncbi:dUTP diphosphatase [Candidatus Parcubacteria bacterium]|nr:MAG: dUTP diphosphatase [Candidatus Parcubacteria bacterium]